MLVGKCEIDTRHALQSPTSGIRPSPQCILPDELRSAAASCSDFPDPHPRPLGPVGLLIYLLSAYELPSEAVVRRPISRRPLSQSPPRDGRSGVTERPDGPGTQSEQAILREVEAGPQWEPRGSVTTWPLPDRADSAFPHIRFRVFPTDTSAVMKVIVTYIRSIVQDRVVGRLREMKVPGASLFPVHGFGLERPSHDWWVSPPRPANRQFHERCVFASIPLPP
jgi:hypothetical protein